METAIKNFTKAHLGADFENKMAFMPCNSLRLKMILDNPSEMNPNELSCLVNLINDPDVTEEILIDNFNCCGYNTVKNYLNNPKFNKYVTK